MPRTVPVTALKADGSLITGALWNAGPKALGNFLLAPPIFRGQQATIQNVAFNTWTALSMDAEDVDSDNGHSTTVNNSRYTCQVPGWYWVEGYYAVVNGSALARFAVAVYKNGSAVPGSAQSCIKANDLQAICAGSAVHLAVNDYVETYAWQGTGGTISTFAGTDIRPSLNVFWIQGS